MNAIICCGRLWIKTHNFYRSLCPKPECVTVSIYNHNDFIETWTITDDFIDYLPLFNTDDMSFFIIEAASDIKTVVRIFINPAQLEDADNIYQTIISSVRSKTDIVEMYVKAGPEQISIMDSILPYMWEGNILTIDVLNRLLNTNYEVIHYVDSNFDEKVIDKDHSLIL
jgi:hypothetical protein